MSAKKAQRAKNVQLDFKPLLYQAFQPRLDEVNCCPCNRGICESAESRLSALLADLV